MPLMSAMEVRVCRCPRSQAGEAHPDRVLHEQMNVLLSRLGEAERRCGMPPSRRIGSDAAGSVRSCRSRAQTRRRSVAARRRSPAPWPPHRSRSNGSGGSGAAGRQSIKDPGIVTALEELVEPVTASDPMSEQKWVRASLRHLSRRLGKAGHPGEPADGSTAVGRPELSAACQHQVARVGCRPSGSRPALPAHRGAAAGL